MPNFPKNITPTPGQLPPGSRPVVKPAGAGTDSLATPQPVAGAQPQTEIKATDGKAPKGAADTPIDPVVQVTFPNVVPGTGKVAGDPTASQAADTVAPASLPKKLSESYLSLGKRVNADPKINYIDIEKADQNKGLSQFLNQFKDQLDSTPGLRDKLSQTPAGQQLLEVLDNAGKGKLSSQDIVKLQSFIVSAGEDISHPNSPTGIDGAFGPRTHQGLQNAFDKLLKNPDETIGKFKENFAAAETRVKERMADYENMGGYVPAGGYSDESRAAGNVPGGDNAGATNVPPAASGGTALGRDIAGAVNQSRGPMAAYLREHGGYYCYRGVKDVLSRVNPPIKLDGGSAYQAADQLRTRYADRFNEVKLTVPPNAATRDYLKKLPPGAVVVWGHSNNPAKYQQGLKAGNGYAHGHISVALGNGYEFSDRDRPQITGPGDPERYGSLSVFIPK